MTEDTNAILYELQRIMHKLDELDRKINDIEYQLRLVKRDVRS
jgi:hypothetical protein